MKTSTDLLVFVCHYVILRNSPWRAPFRKRGSEGGYRHFVGARDHELLRDECCVTNKKWIPLRSWSKIQTIKVHQTIQAKQLEWLITATKETTRHSMLKMSASRNPEEESSLPSDEALGKVHNHIKEVFDILTNETKKVRKERGAFEEAAKKLKHVHFSEMVKLNVGGHLFSTSLETLKKDPGMFLKIDLLFWNLEILKYRLM